MVRGKHLCHSPHVCRDDENPSRNCLQICETKSLCNRKVQEDIPVGEDLWNLGGFKEPSSEHLILQFEVGDYLGQYGLLRPVAIDLKLGLGISLANNRN